MLRNHCVVWTVFRSYLATNRRKCKALDATDNVIHEKNQPCRCELSCNFGFVFVFLRQFSFRAQGRILVFTRK